MARSRRPLSKSRIDKVKEKLQDVMMPPASVEPMPEPLTLDTLYEVAHSIQDNLPPIARQLILDAQDTDTSAHTRLAIFKELGAFILAGERLAQGMGLVRNAGKSGKGDEVDDKVRKLFGVGIDELQKMNQSEVTRTLE